MHVLNVLPVDAGPMSPKEFADTIDELQYEFRKQFGGRLTQLEIATAIGRTNATFSGYKSGGVPTQTGILLRLLLHHMKEHRKAKYETA